MEAQQYFLCPKPEHNNLEIRGVCLEKACKENRLCCFKCGLKSHNSHSMNNILLISDLPIEIEKLQLLKFKKEDLKEYSNKVEEIFEIVLTRIADQVNKIKERLLFKIQKQTNYMDKRLSETSKIINEHIFVRIKDELEKNLSFELLEERLEKIIVNDETLNYAKNWDSLKKTFDFSIPEQEQVNEEVEKILHHLNEFEVIFDKNFKLFQAKNFFDINNDVIYIEDMQNAIGIKEQLDYTYLLSKKNFRNKKAKLKFVAEVVGFNPLFFFGIIKGENYKTGRVSVYYDNTSCFFYYRDGLNKSNNMLSSNSFENFVNKFETNKTEITIDLDAANNKFTIKIGDFLITKDEAYSINNENIHIFVSLSKNGIKKVKFFS